MDEKQETIADIIADIHGLVKPGETLNHTYELLNGLADRLEAAWKREKTAIEADALAVGGLVEASHKRELSKNTSKNGADFGRLGNAAKLREALVKFVHAYEQTDEMANIEATAEAYELARAALAAPRKNCDVGTAEEQKKRFSKFCTEHTDPMDIDGWQCDKKCPLYKNHPNCRFVWAQMPYEEGGAK